MQHTQLTNIADARRPLAQGALAKLAIAALKYAQALAIDDVARLSARMYFYNRQPVTPAWKRRFAAPDGLAEYLGIQAGGSNAVLLERAWRSTALPASNDGWLSWRSRAATSQLQASDMTYKLYVSPRSEWVREAFRAALEVLTAQRVPSFKIGKDVYGLLRPDKIVAYFGSFEQLAEAADALQRAFDGRPYLAMEWCAGVSAIMVAQELRQIGGAEGRKQLLDLCLAILDAYAHLHAQHVVHSDVHPNNILIDGDGSVKIIDYGLARLDGAAAMFAEQVLREIWDRLDSFAAIRECSEIAYLGIAHGWAGMLYATLRWCQVSGSPLPDGVTPRLQQLAECAEYVSRGARWKWMPHQREHTGNYMPGWCNGSAGYVPLWTLAHELVHDAAYLKLAEKAAWNAW